MTKFVHVIAATTALALAFSVHSSDHPASPSFGIDGTASAPAFDLPPSDSMSDDATKLQPTRIKYSSPISHSQEPGNVDGHAQTDAAQLPEAQYDYAATIAFFH